MRFVHIRVYYRDLVETSIQLFRHLADVMPRAVSREWLDELAAKDRAFLDSREVAFFLAFAYCKNLLARDTLELRWHLHLHLLPRPLLSLH